MAEAGIPNPFNGKRVKDLPASGTTLVESLPLTQFRELRYFIVFFNADETISKRMEMSVKKEGTSLTEVVFNRSGQGISLEVNPTENSGDMEMRVSNNELFDVKMCYTRLTL